MLPEGLQDRLRELRRRRKDREALVAEAEAAIVRVEHGHDEDAWVPVSPLDPPRNRPAHPVPAGTDGAETVAGLDAEGRAVLVRGVPDDGRLQPLRAVAKGEGRGLVLHHRVLRHLGARTEVVGLLTADDVSHVTWADRDEQGRLVRLATAGMPESDVLKAWSLTELRWEGDRCVVATTRAREERREWIEVRTGTYDEGGLLEVHRAYDGAPPEPDWHRDLDGWSAGDSAPAEALPAWLDGLARALEARAAPDLVAAVVFPGTEGSSAYLTTAAQRDALLPRVETTSDLLYAGEPLPLDDDLDAEGRRALRALRARGDEPLDEDAVTAALDALAHRLTDLAPAPFLPLVRGEDEHDEDPELDRARRVLGDARVDAALAALGPSGDAPVRPEVVEPPTSPEALRELLRAFALPPALEAQAAWGLLLLDGGSGRSALGGGALLPSGTAWPEAEGRPLTHLATLHLDELPAVEGRDVLPAGGALVVFADLSEEGELQEPLVVGDDDRVVVLHVPAGAEATEHKPPRKARLRRRPVRFEPVLTLPERPEGLSTAEALDYERLWMALLDALPEPAHMVLGHPATVQEDPREPGDVSVLHLGWDEELGLELLDGGDLTFFGAPADVRAGCWDRLRVDVQSA